MLSPTGKPNGVILMSGTMLSNSMGELYNIQRFLQPQVLKAHGLNLFDNWAKTFAEVRTDIEPTIVGNAYQYRERLAELVNVGDLMRMAFQVVSIVRGDDVGLKRPKIEGGKPQPIIVKQNQYVKAYQEIITERLSHIEHNPRGAMYQKWDKAQGKMVDVNDNMLRVVSDASAVAIDQRLIHDYENTPIQEDSKIFQAAEKIVAYYKKHNATSGTQLVFCDRGVPKGSYSKTKDLTQEEFEELNEDKQQEYIAQKTGESETNFNVYDGLTEELVKRGIPREEIAYIHDADAASTNTRDRKLKKLFSDVNKGKIRVLIGTSWKLGTGTNVQKKVVAIHNLDIWWNYSMYGQRNARGVRPSNENAEVAIIDYATEDTVDRFRWDKVRKKGETIDTFMSGNTSTRRLADISFDTVNARTMAAITSSDARQLELAELEMKFRNLEFSRVGFNDGQRRAKEKIYNSSHSIDKLNHQKLMAQVDLGEVKQVDAIRFTNDDPDKFYIFKKHGKEIAERLEAIRKDPNTRINLTRVKDAGAPVGILGKVVETTELDEKGKEVKVQTFQPITSAKARFKPFTQVD
jgi:hypothetical protein